MSLDVPYDVKEQSVRYTTLTGTPYVPPYGDIHHRSETLRGIADGELLVLWSQATGASEWRFGAGTTLPLGATVPDPIELGREGKRHEHLQFGAGVFMPQIEAAWSRRAHDDITTSALVQMTAPVYENNRGYRPPTNLRWQVGPTFRAGSVSYDLRLAGQYQTVGRWHGEADEGTGFSNGGVRLQIALPWRSLTIEPSIYRELYSHGLHDETFSQGTTAGLSITRTF